MFKISVIIPTLNEEKSITFLLECLLNQSYLPNEILISDGGSKDNTIDIVNNFSKINPCIKIIKRSGSCRGNGRNEGIENANNEYIALIDAGTYPDKNWLENLIKPIKNNQNIKIAYGSAKPITILT